MRPLAFARRSTGLLVTTTVVLVDQVTKVAATHDPSSIVLPVRNPAYALGIVSGPAPVLIIGSVVVLAAFVVMVDALASRFEISAFLPALVAGGMVGNTIDRIRLGSVRDFLVTPWAIINLADIAVAAGIVGVIFTLAARVPRRRVQLATSAGTA
ncbi:MAG: signal peptidase II [Acidimicrobiia bacterium]